VHSPSQKFGRRGEDLAAEFLRRRGHRVLGRAVRVGRLGELDLITERGGVLVFVEVKTRTGAGFGAPEAAVTPTKLLRLSRAIAGYLRARGLERVRHRLDVVAVEWGNPPTIRHLEDIGP
jgi:putative endonuclease